MKSLYTYITESQWKESPAFKSLAKELTDNEDKLLKYFKGATEVQVGSSNSEIYLTVIGPKGKKIDLFNNLKEMLIKTKNFKDVMNEIKCYAFQKEYNKESDKYEVVVAQDSVAEDNFEYLKSHNKDSEIAINLSKLN